MTFCMMLLYQLQEVIFMLGKKNTTLLTGILITRYHAAVVLYKNCRQGLEDARELKLSRSTDESLTETELQKFIFFKE